MFKLAQGAQVIIALSVAFVWILRLPNVIKEFHEYGLSDLVRTLVGATKISLATLLIAGIWYPALVLIPALLMAFLMLCAEIAHFKVRHPLQKYAPAFVLLLLSLFVSAVYANVIRA